jgi:hypothetical protein
VGVYDIYLKKLCSVFCAVFVRRFRYKKNSKVSLFEKGADKETVLEKYISKVPK